MIENRHSFEDQGGHFDEDFLKSSNLYSQYIKRGIEVDRHKWYESERAGRDVGVDYAFFDWLLKHGNKWHTDLNR